MKTNRKTDPLNQRSKIGLHAPGNAFPLTKLDWILILLVFIVALVGALFGEKVTVNAGQGWDGELYAAIARDFSFQHIGDLGLESYHVQRILPSVVVHYALRLLGVPLTTPHIILGFAWLNVAILTLSALAWCLICNHLKMGPVGKIVGVLGMFGGFALTKFPSFYPILTDMAGFFLGIWMLYFYLTRKTALLLLATIAGAFTWPTLLYEGIIFLLFLHERPGPDPEARPAVHHLNIWAALLTSLVLFGAFLWEVINYDPALSMRPIMEFLPVSILIALWYWFFGLAPLLDSARYFSPLYWFRQIRPVTWVITLLCVVGIKFAQGMISTPTDIGASAFHKILLMPIFLPAKFLVAHVFFYGPLVLLMLFWWKPMAQFIRAQGPGLVLNAILGLFSLLASESRQAINLLPIFVLAAAYVADSAGWQKRHLWVFGILAAVFSRVWIPLNGDASLAARGFAWLFPNQAIILSAGSPNLFYWSSFGPWMTNEMYMIEAVLVVLFAFLVYLVLIRSLGKTIRSAE